MEHWNVFPHLGDYRFDAESLGRQWQRLHAGDAEPKPEDPLVMQAWVALHNGDFHTAATIGLAAGEPGLAVANKATCLYANYLETAEAIRLQLFKSVAQRAQAQAAQDPRNPSPWFWHAYALGRYSQAISVANALAQGLGGTVKESLETVIKLQPLHADAHVALGAFHAEVIDKVGALVAGMTYGASRDVAIGLFKAALKLNPHSASAMIEYANALLMLEGEQRMAEATRLYEAAAACQPMDALERLAVDLAQAELLE